MTKTAHDLTQLSLSLLPLEDLQAYLQLKQGFVAGDESAYDTLHVAGIPSGNIAISIEGDRHTVSNSLKLGDREASEYLTVDDGGKIITSFEKIRSTYTKEMTDIRDEFYQLKSDLTRQGIVANVDSYKGFHDTFNKHDVIYNQDPVCEIEAFLSTSKIRTTQDLSNDVFIGDYLVIKNVAENIDGGHVCRVTDVENETFTFMPSYPGDTDISNVEVVKSLGTYYKGSFAFASKDENVPSNEVNHSTVDDDQYVKNMNIVGNGTGVAYSFKLGMQAFSGVEDKTAGYLCDLKLRGTVVNEAKLDESQTLTAYVIHERDRANFKNVEQAQEDNLIVAQSQPLVVSSRRNSHVFPFTFRDGDQYPVVRSHDDNLIPVRYCLIVVTENPNGKDFPTECAIAFNTLYSQEGAVEADLQTNNSMYRFHEVAYNSNDSSTTIDIDFQGKELYYSFGTREIVENTIVPFQNGLYTVSRKLPDCMKASYARVTLRVHREGMFEVSAAEADTHIKAGDLFAIAKEQGAGGSYDLYSTNGIGLNAVNSGHVIVGGKLIKGVANGIDQVVAESAVEIESRADVLNIDNYVVRLVAIKHTFNEDTATYETEKRVAAELAPSCVVRDRIRKDDTVSDRIIFEGVFEDEDGEPILFDEYELQIAWKSPYSSNVLLDEESKEHLYGAISHINLTLDATI